MWLGNRKQMYLKKKKRKRKKIVIIDLETQEAEKKILINRFNKMDMFDHFTSITSYLQQLLNQLFKLFILLSERKNCNTNHFDLFHFHILKSILQDYYTFNRN